MRAVLPLLGVRPMCTPPCCCPLRFPVRVLLMWAVSPPSSLARLACPSRPAFHSRSGLWVACCGPGGRWLFGRLPGCTCVVRAGVRGVPLGRSTCLCSTCLCMVCRCHVDMWAFMFNIVANMSCGRYAPSQPLHMGQSAPKGAVLLRGAVWSHFWVFDPPTTP